MNGMRFGLGLVSLTLLGVAAACASNEATDPRDVITPDAASDTDAGVIDSSAPPPELGGDAACDDCAWFTTDCTPTTICKIGVELDPLAKLNAVTATDTDVVAVGASGLVVRHDGTAWSIKHLAEPDTMTQIIRRPAGGLWAMGGPLYAGPNAEESSGFARTTLPGRGYISGLWGSLDSTRAWAVGNGIYRIDAPEDGSLSITDLQAYSLYTYGFTAGGINAIHGAPDGVLWGVGRIGGSYRLWDLDAPTPQTDALNTQTYATLYGVWAVQPNDVWAVGDKGTIRHYTGHGRMWDVVENPVSSTLRAIWAASAADIWAVGDEGVVLHYDGTTWQRVPVAGLGLQRPNLRAVWGTGSDRLFAVGDNVVLGLGPSSEGGVK